MKNLLIYATNVTPEILFNLNGEFSVKGISIPEKATKFYQDILLWIDEQKEFFPPKIKLTLTIEYMNTPSKKFMILLIKKLIESCHNKNKLEIEWMYDHEVMDLKEEGEMIEEVVGYTFSFKKY